MCFVSNNAIQMSFPVAIPPLDVAHSRPTNKSPSFLLSQMHTHDRRLENFRRGVPAYILLIQRRMRRRVTGPKHIRDLFERLAFNNTKQTLMSCLKWTAGVKMYIDYRQGVSTLKLPQNLFDESYHAIACPLVCSKLAVDSLASILCSCWTS